MACPGRCPHFTPPGGRFRFRTVTACYGDADPDTHRFPSFLGVAVDKTEPKDAEVPEHRKPGGTGPNDV